MSINEKEYDMLFTTNKRTAWCRACHKELAPKEAFICEGTSAWNYNNGLVLCKNCCEKVALKLLSLLKVY